MSGIPKVEPDRFVRHSELTDFLNAHAGWAAGFATAVPKYAIPEVALDQLSISLSEHTPALFSIEAVAVERTFTRLCNKLRAVGIWGTNVVTFSLLDPPSTEASSAFVQSLGWTPAQIAATTGLVNRADSANTRRIGAMGWLMTEPSFHRELDDLREEWATLPDFLKCRPLTRTLISTSADATSNGFEKRLVSLLDRWGLIELTTWDLPLPQGPLVPNSVPSTSQAQPVHGVHIFVPIHYPIQGDEDLIKRVREIQRAHTSDLGIDSGFAGIDHHAAYAQMFRMSHLERAIASRFRDHRPRGFVGHVERAAVNVLRVKSDRVKRLRTGIAACLRGQRDQVSWLRRASQSR